MLLLAELVHLGYETVSLLLFSVLCEDLIVLADALLQETPSLRLSPIVIAFRLLVLRVYLADNILHDWPQVGRKL